MAWVTDHALDVRPCDKSACNPRSMSFFIRCRYDAAVSPVRITDSRFRIDDATASTLPYTSPATIPILGYSQIASVSQFCVDLTSLSAQMAYLSSQGFMTISPEAYAAWLDGLPVVGMPAKPALVTFSSNIHDCQRCGCHGHPLQQYFSVSATTFVVSGFADTPDGWNMDWTQLVGLRAAGWFLQLNAGPLGQRPLVGTPSTSGCAAFFACPLSGESVSSYATRIMSDISLGEQAMLSRVALSHDFVSHMCAVPFTSQATIRF
jgi:hypothetical protein